MHGRHPKTAIDLCIIFINVAGLLIGDHAHAGPTPLKRPTEMDLVIAVGHREDVAQAQTL